MSCGNRFQCGLSKPSRSQFKPDKPSNTELHNENQKRLKYKELINYLKTVEINDPEIIGLYIVEAIEKIKNYKNY